MDLRSTDQEVASFVREWLAHGERGKRILRAYVCDLRVSQQGFRCRRSGEIADQIVRLMAVHQRSLIGIPSKSSPGAVR